MSELQEKQGTEIAKTTDDLCFIEGENLLEKFGLVGAKKQEAELKQDHLEKAQRNLEQSIQVRVGTLVKTDHMSFLLGAGVSKDAGGVLLGSIPLAIEQKLLDAGIRGNRVRKWLKLFYLAAGVLARDGVMIPKTSAKIIERQKTVGEALRGDDVKQKESRIAINFEDLLSRLYCWRMSLPEKGESTLRIDAYEGIRVQSRDLDECIDKAKSALVECCKLPIPEIRKAAIASFETFLRKVLTRPINLHRASIFTLNYDLMIEQAADACGAVLLDGFTGTVNPVFRPESYDHDLYYPGDTTEGRVHRLERVLHLYKLHGSINWVATEPDVDNPYGIKRSQSYDIGPLLVYPTPLKYGDTLGLPYSEMFRRFAAAIVRPQSTLFVIGYAFGDPHVNSVIVQALAIPSFTLVIADPYIPMPDAKSPNILARLLATEDRRVWRFGGNFGRFATFANKVMPDLRDEEVRRKVASTYRSLKEKSGGNEENDGR